jgi:hypothetical protein
LTFGIIAELKLGQAYCRIHRRGFEFLGRFAASWIQDVNDIDHCRLPDFSGTLARLGLPSRQSLCPYVLVLRLFCHHAINSVQSSECIIIGPSSFGMWSKRIASSGELVPWMRRGSACRQAYMRFRRQLVELVQAGGAPDELPILQRDGDGEWLG